MSLKLNVRKWWECFGDELWAMNLRRPDFVAQDDEFHRCGGNRALFNLRENMFTGMFMFIQWVDRKWKAAFEKLEYGF